MKVLFSCVSWSFSFAVEKFGHTNKENTSSRMDKSINLNPVGNTESFGSPMNSALSSEIVKSSNTLFTFVKTWLVSTSSSTLAITVPLFLILLQVLESFFFLYWDFFSFRNTSFGSFVITTSRINLSFNSFRFINFQ